MSNPAPLLSKLTAEKRDLILICKRCARRSLRTSNRPIRDQKVHCDTCHEETWHIVALAPAPPRGTPPAAARLASFRALASVEPSVASSTSSVQDPHHD